MAFSGTLWPSSTISAGGNTSTVQDLPNVAGAIFFVDVSAMTGTSPTLQFTLQAYNPASTSYIDVADFTLISATGTYHEIVYPNAAGAIFEVLPVYRIKWVLGGTSSPTATFSIGVNYLN